MRAQRNAFTSDKQPALRAVLALWVSFPDGASRATTGNQQVSCRGIRIRGGSSRLSRCLPHGSTHRAACDHAQVFVLVRRGWDSCRPSIRISCHGLLHPLRHAVWCHDSPRRQLACGCRFLRLASPSPLNLARDQPFCERDRTQDQTRPDLVMAQADTHPNRPSRTLQARGGPHATQHP